MPLWISVPFVLILWLASWISGINAATGSAAESYAVWTITAIATLLLGLRLLRAP